MKKTIVTLLMLMVMSLNPLVLASASVSAPHSHSSNHDCCYEMDLSMMSKMAASHHHSDPSMTDQKTDYSSCPSCGDDCQCGSQCHMNGHAPKMISQFSYGFAPSIAHRIALQDVAFTSAAPSLEKRPPKFL